MSTEIEALHHKHHEDLQQLEEFQKREAELVAALADAEAAHTSAVQELKVAHEEALKAKALEVDDLVAK